MRQVECSTVGIFHEVQPEWANGAEIDSLKHFGPSVETLFSFTRQRCFVSSVVTDPLCASSHCRMVKEKAPEISMFIASFTLQFIAVCEGLCL